MAFPTFMADDVVQQDGLEQLAAFKRSLGPPGADVGLGLLHDYRDTLPPLADVVRQAPTGGNDGRDPASLEGPSTWQAMDPGALPSRGAAAVPAPQAEGQAHPGDAGAAPDQSSAFAQWASGQPQLGTPRDLTQDAAPAVGGEATPSGMAPSALTMPVGAPMGAEGTQSTSPPVNGPPTADSGPPAWLPGRQAAGVVEAPEDTLRSRVATVPNVPEAASAVGQALVNRVNQTADENAAAFTPTGHETRSNLFGLGSYQAPTFTPEQEQQQIDLTGRAVMGVSGGDLPGVGEMGKVAGEAAAPIAEGIGAKVGGAVSRFFHGTDPGTATLLATGTADKTGLNVALSPDLALGQGGKGAIVEMASPDIAATPLRTKPGSAFVEAASGQAPEWEISHAPHNGPDVVASVTFQPGATIPRWVPGALRSNGWQITREADGTVRAVNPRFAERGTAMGSPPAIGGAVLGGALGASQGDTPEERARNAVLGAASGAVGGRLLGSGSRAAGLSIAPIEGEAAKVAGDIERAGNILLSKLPEGVRDVVQETQAAAPQLFEDARRGVVSDATVQQLADQAGTTVQKVIDRWKPGDAANAETINALRASLSAKSDQVAALNQAIAGGDASPATLLRFNAAVREQQAVQQAVSGVTAEAGRGLRALRADITSAVASGDAGQMQTLLQRMGGVQWTQELSDRLGQLAPDDVVGRANFIRDAFRPKLKDYLTELWYNFMLSGPHTVAVKTTSETLNLALSPLERLASSAVEAPLAALQGRPVARFPGEASADVVGMVGGVREGVAKFLYTIQHGFSESQALGQDYLRPRAFKGPVGAVVNFPSNLLAAGVEMMGHIAQSGALNAGAFRQAMGEGLKGDALAARIADLRANPTPALLQDAAAAGKYRTFQKPLGPIGQALMNVRNQDWNGIPVGRILVPFFQTPVNLLKMGLERSPMAAFNVGMWQDLARKNPNAADGIGRWLLGSSIGAALALEVRAGNITGPPPNTPAEADAWRREGKTPYSVRLGDTWVSYQRLEPLNQTLGQAASIVNALGSGQDAGQAAQEFALTIAANLVSQPYMQSLSTFLAALKDPGKGADLFVQGLASSTVPAAARVVAQGLDPTVRRVTNPLEAMQADVPGLSQRLPPRLNAFGEPQTRLTSNVSPVGVSRSTTSPVDAELSRYGVEPGFTGKTLRGIDLTSQEMTEHQRVSGQLVLQTLSELVADPRYQALDDLQKATALQRAITRAKDEGARRYVQQLIDRQGEAAVLRRIAQKKAARMGTAAPVAPGGAMP